MKNTHLETSPSPETSHKTFRGETFQEVSMAGVPQEKTQEITPETNLGIETPQGKDPEHTQETNQGVGMTKKGVKTQEGIEDMMIGEVILAMGVDVENAARRPCVMGGPLLASPWPGSHLRT